MKTSLYLYSFFISIILNFSLLAQIPLDHETVDIDLTQSVELTDGMPKISLVDEIFYFKITEKTPPQIQMKFHFLLPTINCSKQQLIDGQCEESWKITNESCTYKLVFERPASSWAGKTISLSLKQASNLSKLLNHGFVIFNELDDPNPLSLNSIHKFYFKCGYRFKLK